MHGCKYLCFILKKLCTLFNLLDWHFSDRIPSEVFFTNIRAKSMSIATLFNRVFAAIMASTVLTADNTIGWGSYFLLLAVLCVICLVSCFS